jgi:hypothetical protein
LSKGVQTSTPVADDEPLTRFLLFSEWFGTNPPRVKHQAYMPHPYEELSITRIQNLTEETIWNAGQAVAAKQKRTLYGRGDVNNSAVIGVGLSTVPDEPPVGHANIVGWPPLTGVKKADKDEQKIRALQIAAKAHLVLKQT